MYAGNPTSIRSGNCAGPLLLLTSAISMSAVLKGRRIELATLKISDPPARHKIVRNMRTITRYVRKFFAEEYLC